MSTRIAHTLARPILQPKSSAVSQNTCLQYDIRWRVYSGVECTMGHTTHIVVKALGLDDRPIIHRTCREFLCSLLGPWNPLCPPAQI